MPRGGVVTGEGARFKGLALRGREVGDGGRQRGDRGEMCDRLTSCTILNNSWMGPLGGPNPYSPQENSLFVFVEQARKPVLDNSVRYLIVGNRDFRACS
jgi:hypothetical protein